MGTDFQVICEVEPATRPDLMHVRHQIGVMSRVASSFLIPDNHIGRATVSSIAVAHEVALMGGRAIACLNARDRNLLGFRRDLLTAAAYGVDEFLFVYGDRPESGARSDDLSVRSMLTEARRFSDEVADRARPFRVGVTTGLRPLPPWKAPPTSSSCRSRSRSRSCWHGAASVDFEGPVYAGVMVLASRSMAAKLSASVPELAVPTWLADRIERDGDAGIDHACQLIADVEASGAFDGVHLVPVSALPRRVGPAGAGAAGADVVTQLAGTCSTSTLSVGPVVAPAGPRRCSRSRSARCQTSQQRPTLRFAAGAR